MSKEQRPSLNDWVQKHRGPFEINTYSNTVLIELISDYLEAHKEPVEEELVKTAAELEERKDIVYRRIFATPKDKLDKLPEVGKSYIYKDRGDLCSYDLKDFWKRFDERFEELPDQEPTNKTCINCQDEIGSDLQTCTALTNTLYCESEPTKEKESK